jgi:hypothetical protein
MSQDKNFLKRAFDAIVEGRTRQAERYVARFEREHPNLNGKLTKR